MQTVQNWNFKVVFNRSFCRGNYENVKFYLSIKIFHQYIFQVYLPSYSLWAEHFSCHDLANDIQSQTAKTVFSYLNDNDSDKEKEKEKGKENENGKDCKKIVNCKL